MITSQLSSQFLDQSNELIWMVDSNFCLVYANRAYFSFTSDILGDEKKIAETVFSKGFDDHFIKKWKTYYNRAFNGETFEVDEDFFHHQAIDKHELRISFKPIFDDAKKIIAVACQSKESKTSIYQKFESNKLLDTSIDVYCVVNEHDFFTYVSAASYKNWGYLPEEMIGNSIHDFILQDDAKKTNQTISEIVNGNEVKSFFNRYRKKDGSTAYNLWSAKFDSATKLRYAVAKDAKEIIQEKRHLKLLESVITNTHDAVLITEAEPFDNPGPKIIYVNEAFTKMTGYTAEEVIGKTPRILQGPKSNYQELRKLGEALRKWQSYEITTINYKKNGEEFWVNFKINPVADETGWYTHWIAIERDVTESKIIEENLIKAKEIAEENELKMKEAQKLANLGSWYYDVINKKSNWSEETYRIWGLYPENTEIDLVDHKKLVHPKDWERFNSVINNATEKGIPYKMELELICPDDTYKKVNTIGEPIFDENHNVIAFRGTTQDITDRVIIENELRDAKERAEKSQYAMEQASKLAKIGYWEHNFITNKLTWSDYIYELYNLSPEVNNIKYLDAREFFDSQSQEKIIKATKELIKNGTPYDLELRMINSKNEEIFVRNVVQPVYNDDNEIIGKRGIIQNITTEKYLQDLNREVARMVKIGSWSVDLEKETVFWSEQIHELHETDSKTYKPNLHEGTNFYRADFRNMVESSIENAVNTGEGWDFEAVIVTAKKKEIWIRSIGNAEFINGKCIRLYGGLQDIDSRKQAEIRLQSLANNLPGVVFQYFIYTNGTDALKNVTKGSLQVWGFEPEEVMDNNQLVWDRIKIVGDYEKVQKTILESIEHKTKWSCRFKYVMPNGELKILLGRGTPNVLADGTIQFNSILLDVSQEAKNEELLKRYTLELERSNEELEQFAYVASHDLQEPLRMISSFMDLLKRKYADKIDEKGQQYINFATDGAKRMKNLILDLLEYSRAGRTNEVRENVDLDLLLFEFKELRRKIIEEKKATLVYDQLPTIQSYRVPLTQIFHCLLDNALNYSKTDCPPIVEISYKEDDSNFIFVIKDNGIGIHPNYHDKIFLIFQRLHNNDKFTGTGIGLSLVKRQVEYLGGSIWLESEEEKGTTFFIQIPKNIKQLQT
ncbi:PAS domain-containing protein [Polaribacter gangjinensis]|uniref:histidine kinase n=1 Tax=Polaribacter gangjinensis TaxID=574710 RepID=A0A2S7WAI6_9FLAO|nr:PAS domain-containing protein [Polaribacter gangjinensis]PQJ74597.1 hypothetical protein BTO13_04700 [Polaribacter gangjinensis]